MRLRLATVCLAFAILGAARGGASNSGKADGEAYTKAFKTAVSDL